MYLQNNISHTVFQVSTDQIHISPLCIRIAPSGGVVSQEQVRHLVALSCCSYTTPVPVWSCEWDADDPNYFYAGLTGTVRVFDMRNTSVHVQDVVPKGTRSPVIALRHVSRDLQSAFRWTPTNLAICRSDMSLERVHKYGSI